jgi:ubiquinone/menaquinone biosynthesis C-methylase UbiE
MSRIVRDFYDSDVEREWHRLDEALCQIEFASTLRLIEKYFPPTGRICDIGGGPGRYAVALAQRGYRMTLVELSAGLLKRAEVALGEAGVEAERLVSGDACELRDLPDACFDAGLLLGPLYHLIDRAKRLVSLNELKRILKPGAVAIVAYLNSWGILRCGVADFPERYGDMDFIRSLLNEKSFAGSLSGFTECHWATPKTALAEIEESGWELLSYAGAEGFAGGMRPMVERVAAERPAVFRNLLQMGAETAELRQYRDATEHLHVVVRRPFERL